MLKKHKIFIQNTTADTSKQDQYNHHQNEYYTHFIEKNLKKQTKNFLIPPLKPSNWYSFSNYLSHFVIFWPKLIPYSTWKKQKLLEVRCWTSYRLKGTNRKWAQLVKNVVFICIWFQFLKEPQPKTIWFLFQKTFFEYFLSSKALDDLNV